MNPILLATPVFLLLIGLEYWRDRTDGGQAYHLADAICSLSIGCLSQISGHYGKAIGAAVYLPAYAHLALWRLDPGEWSVWLLALLLYDFCYYWQHRCSHEVNILWAAHVVHHSSEDYNLTTALRQTSSGVFLGWLFYLPMALVGIPPPVMVAAGLINLLSQYWIHTRKIGRLGWFDLVFASPSNHRVHHGQNDYCIDRNYGGMLMLWDHLFGSFVAERPDETIIYGIRGPLRSVNPLWANLHVYRDLLRDMMLAGNLRDGLRVLIKHPGWRPPAAAAKAPKPAWSLSSFRPFQPDYHDRRRFMAVFVLLLALFLLWLGFVNRLQPDHGVIFAALLIAGFGWLGVQARQQR